MEDRKVATINWHKNALERFLNSEAITPGAWGNAEHTDDHSIRRAEDRHSPAGIHFPTSRWACIERLGPVVFEIVRIGENSLLTNTLVPSAEAACLCLALISIFYGYDWRHALSLGVGKPASKISPGWIDIDSGILWRQIGTGFYAGDDCFRRSEFALPILPPIQNALKVFSAGRQFSSLAEILGENIDFLPWLRTRVISVVGNIFRRSTGLHQSFDAAAMHYCGIDVEVLSLLRGRPMLSSRGATSYVRENGAALYLAWRKIMDRIRYCAGVSEHSDLFWVTPFGSRQHGRRIPAYSTCVQMVLKLIEEAKSHNDILFCLELAIRLLGKRNRHPYLNPAKSIRLYPEPYLQMADKFRDGRPVGTRPVPLVAGIDTITRACHELLDSCEALPFQRNQSICFSGEFPVEQRPSALKGGETRQFLRNAFANEMRHRKYSTDVRNMLLGHNEGTGINSFISPIAGGALFAQAKRDLEAMLRETGFEAMADRLAQRMRQLIDPGVVTKAGKTSPSQLWTTRINVHDDTEKFPRLEPMTVHEDAAAAALLDALATGASLPKRPWAVAVYLALELGVPLPTPSGLAQYFTFRSILKNARSTEYHLLVPCLHADLGGLSAYPIAFPEQSKALALIFELFAKLAKKKHAIGETARLNQQLLGSGEDFRRDIGVYVSRLLTASCGRRVRVSNGYAIRLLSRAAQHLCRWQQPGSAAAALMRRKGFELNFIRPKDVILRIEKGPCELLHINDTAYEGIFYCGRARKNVCRFGAEDTSRFSRFIWRVKRNKGKLRDRILKSENPAEELINAISPNPFRPSSSRFSEIFEAAGFEGRKSLGLSRSLYAYFRRNGLLEPSDPLTLPDEATITSFAERLANLDLDVRIGVFSFSKEEVNRDAAQRIAFAFEYGARSDEALDVTRSQIIALIDGNWLHIDGTKTESADRPVFSSLMLGSDSPIVFRQPWKILDRELVRKRGYADEDPSHRGSTKNYRNSINKQIRRLFDDDFDVTQHGLRHVRGFLCLEYAMNRPNCMIYLAAVASMLGHISLVTSLDDYVGTALAVFQERFNAAHSYSNRLLWMPLVQPLYSGHGKLESELSDQYSGRAIAKSDFLREIQRLSALPATDRDSGHVVFVDTLSAQTHQNSSQTGEWDWIVFLPPRTGIPEFWQTLNTVASMAIRKRLNVGVHVPEKILQRYHQRFEAIHNVTE